MAEPTEAVAYYRISLYRGDGGEAPAIERQRELVEALAERKEWTITREYVDQDCSAYSRRPRRGYQRMLSAIESGEVGAVLVLDQDRLVRRTRELERFIELADRHGVRLANVSGEIDFGTPEGRFRARMMGNMAEYESDKKAERHRREREQKARQGRSHGGPRPYGWRREREIDPVTGRTRSWLLVDEAEAGRLWEAAERVLAGESVYPIAREWTAAGVPTAKTASGWDAPTLRLMLTRPRNAGLRTYHPSNCCARKRSCPNVEIVAVGDWEPLWDRETHERLCAVLGPTRQGIGRPRNAHLLSGMIDCHCGGRMSTMAARGRVRYVCVNRGGACGACAIVAGPLEDFVVEAVLRALASGALERLMAVECGENERAAAAAETLRSCEEKLASLAADYADGVMSRAEWLAARERVEKRAAAARRTLDAVTGSAIAHGLPSDPAGLAEHWETRTLDQHRAILAAVVEQVTVNRAPPRPRTGHPGERVEIAWKV